MKYTQALVIGGGAFGTSIADVLSRNFDQVLVHVRSPELYQDIQQGENTRYLPGHKLASSIQATLDWKGVENVEFVVLGLPTKALAGFIKEHHKVLTKLLNLKIPCVCLAKGLEGDSLLDDLLAKLLPEHQSQLCFLSGPSFAQEIAEQQITLVSLAGTSEEVLKQAAAMLRTNYFKAIPTLDVKGVLLGGALKNMLAIAAGILEGLGYNHNTRAALLTQGIEEMLKLGKVFGAQPETFYGLSGMGDLILTTTGGLSRNYSFGIELASGKKAEDILKSSRGVVEGYRTTQSVHHLIKKHNLDCWILSGLYEVLYEDKDPKIVLSKLLKLVPKK